MYMLHVLRQAALSVVAFEAEVTSVAPGIGTVIPEPAAIPRAYSIPISSMTGFNNNGTGQSAIRLSRKFFATPSM